RGAPEGRKARAEKQQAGREIVCLHGRAGESFAGRSRSARGAARRQGQRFSEQENGLCGGGNRPRIEVRQGQGIGCDDPERGGIREAHRCEIRKAWSEEQRGEADSELWLWRSRDLIALSDRSDKV